MDSFLAVFLKIIALSEIAPLIDIVSRQWTAKAQN